MHRRILPPSSENRSHSILFQDHTSLYLNQKFTRIDPSIGRILPVNARNTTCRRSPTARRTRDGRSGEPARRAPQSPYLLLPSYHHGKHLAHAAIRSKECRHGLDFDTASMAGAEESVSNSARMCDHSTGGRRVVRILRRSTKFPHQQHLCRLVIAIVL